MEYRPRDIEKKWQKHWKDKDTYKVSNHSDKPKFYVLDMFPYPSGAGLHVGHPLGYIASDIFSRYKRLKGFNVLHPMGYDAFGLPAEQYAIQTGVHPAKSTDENIARYRAQLDNIGFNYDWSREVRTCDPAYYKWTQWIFLQLFGHFYDKNENKARPIEDLISIFEKAGNAGINAASSQESHFSAAEWAQMSPKEKDDVLMNYRLAYRKVTFVNWCEALGTVLANDEVKDGVSERGGYPVERKPMLQWSLRITAYAERLLRDLDNLEWSEAMKKMQSNWIGRSEGAQLFFRLADTEESIEIYTTRPDTIFGATFMVLAPEHDLVSKITAAGKKAEVENYIEYVKSRSERERMSEVKEVTGADTGAFAVNPFTGEQIPIWISEYVLKDYGTGAIMAVPADDERDRRFAEKFGLPIIEIIDKSMHPGATIEDKVGKMINSDFLNGLEVLDAIELILQKIEERGIGKRQVNYKLRDAIYSRQRYWGEPFPIKYDKEGIAHPMDVSELPLELPELDDFKPASGAKSPLARATDWVNLPDGFTRETDTMPGFAGSSWYFLRYMDAQNPDEFASREALNYWRDVDLYIGGTEHAVGHLMYSRFWHKFLYDKGLVPTNEPFKKLVNQGMIQGVSEKVHILKSEIFAARKFKKDLIKRFKKIEIIEDPLVGKSKYDFLIKKYNLIIEIKKHHTSISRPKRVEPMKQFAKSKKLMLVEIPADDIIDNLNEVWRRLENLIKGKDKIYRPIVRSDEPKTWLIQPSKATKSDYYITTVHNIPIDLVNDRKIKRAASISRKYKTLGPTKFYGEKIIGDYDTESEVEKMSKSKYNVINPDDVVEKYGADTFRMYEMFLGPIEQSKPWDTKGISGVYNFLRKAWDLFFDKDSNWSVSESEPTPEELKILHTAIKRVTEDIERFSFNTCVSHFMICVNELRRLECNKRQILEPFTVLLAPFAPHIAEEWWSRLGFKDSVHHAVYPVLNEAFLKEDTVNLPIAINGKTRAVVAFPADATKEHLEKTALELDEIKKWLEGAEVKKVIVVPGRMVNVVI